MLVGKEILTLNLLMVNCHTYKETETLSQCLAHVIAICRNKELFLKFLTIIIVYSIYNNYIKNVPITNFMVKKL